MRWYVTDGQHLQWTGCKTSEEVIRQALDWAQEVKSVTEMPDLWGQALLVALAFGMIVNDTVPPRVVQGIITTALTGLGHIFGLGGMPPALPPHA